MERGDFASDQGTDRRVYEDGTLVGSTPAPGFLVGRLACGATHSFSVDAYDAADNRSAQTTVSAAAIPCADTLAPMRPAGWR